MGAVRALSDLHPGNLLICPQPATKPGFFIIDWDQPVLAPKERDRMGTGGLGARWSSPREVECFYTGCAPGNNPANGSHVGGIDPVALTCYRCERVLADIAAFCEQLLLSETGGADREQSLGYFTSSFLPGHEIDAARKGDLCV